ncbi:GNAT family N-acetyltransferase [uncultured Actinomyces sp.]|jgi:hypothetical protein avisC_06894|uniref:GNAT family N-acetyltransferase n=1 Tax=uncultured Actinomyces sp. TaxID=249061 RepID=UPI0028ECD57D|nr:GNAT family N-acetyltransferase [uncultured Actinomyces sp.]
MDGLEIPVLDAPRRLAHHDKRSDFTCGNDELDTWFHRYAWHNQRANNAVTYVCQQSGRIAGYYALAAATIRREWSPDDFAAHRPRSIPCMLLARLAVDRRVQGQGVGATLLLDALRRTLAASDQFGIAALLIHCKDEHARDFYTHHVDALVSPIAPLQLIVPTQTIALALGTAHE